MPNKPWLILSSKYVLSVMILTFRITIPNHCTTHLLKTLKSSLTSAKTERTSNKHLKHILIINLMEVVHVKV